MGLYEFKDDGQTAQATLKGGLMLGLIFNIVGGPLLIGGIVNLILYGSNMSDCNKVAHSWFEDYCSTAYLGNLIAGIVLTVIGSKFTFCFASASMVMADTLLVAVFSLVGSCVASISRITIDRSTKLVTLRKAGCYGVCFVVAGFVICPT